MRGNHSGPLTTVFLKGIFQRIVPIVPWEVDVDVRWVLAIFIEKTFEEEIVSYRIDLRDSEKIGDKACCGRSTATRVGVLFGNVLHDQKVLGKSLATDDVEFFVEPTFDLGGHVPIPMSHPVEAFLLQKKKEVSLLFHSIPGDNPRTEIPVVLDPIDNGMRVHQGFGCPGELLFDGCWGFEPLIRSGMKIWGESTENTVQADHPE